MDKYIANTDIESGYSCIIGPNDFEAWFQLPQQYDGWFEDSRGVVDTMNKMYENNNTLLHALNRMDQHIRFGTGPSVDVMKSIISDVRKQLND